MFSRLFIFKAVAYYRKGLFRKGITVENLIYDKNIRNSVKKKKGLDHQFMFMFAE